MGRAFPEIPQVTMEIAGISPNPAVMTDERGNVIVFRATDGDWMERMERAAAVEFGGMSWSSEYQLTVEQAKAGAVVNHAVSLAVRLGTVVAEAEHDPVEALAREIHAARLIVGKVVDVERRTTAGFVRGSATIEGLDADAGRTLRLEIQNENLVALEGDRALAMVPDIITVLDSQTANAISTERLRYGQRVTVIAFPCDPIWRTAKRPRARRARGLRLRPRLRAGGGPACPRLTCGSASTSAARTPTPWCSTPRTASWRRRRCPRRRTSPRGSRARSPASSSRSTGARITHAMLGTTHATNAVLERRGLRRVGVLRLGGPATHAIRPLFGWPADLREAVSAGERIVHGGIEFDGRELSPLDAEAIARFAGEVAGSSGRDRDRERLRARSPTSTSARPRRSSARSSATCRSRSAPRSARSACSSARTPPS